MFSHLDEVEMTRKYRKEHDLMGYEAEDLIDEFDNLKERDLKNTMLQIMSGPGFEGNVDTTDLEYMGVQPEQTTPQI